MLNKVKNTRKVTFSEDYSSPSEIERAKKENRQPEVIYRKGSVHYIRHEVVASLKDKGAKMKVEMYDPAPDIKKAKEALAEK